MGLKLSYIGPQLSYMGLKLSHMGLKLTYIGLKSLDQALDLPFRTLVTMFWTNHDELTL